MIIGLIAFIEFIIYLTKSDEEFHKIYIQGKSPGSKDRLSSAAKRPTDSSPTLIKIQNPT